MIFDYSKLNVIIYFLTGIVSSLVFKRYIFGGLILFLSFGIIVQYSILHSEIPVLLKYQNVSAFLSYIGVILVLGSSLYILSKSKIEDTKKMYSLAILALTILFYVVKETQKSKYEFLQKFMIQQIPSILFMVYLLLISIVPENEDILEDKIGEIMYKTEYKNL
jgi:hypothetical protein